MTSSKEKQERAKYTVPRKLMMLALCFLFIFHFPLFPKNKNNKT